MHRPHVWKTHLSEKSRFSRPLDYRFASRYEHSTSKTMTLSQTLADAQISIPGLKNVFNKHSSILRKIIWVIAIIGCTSVCIYQVCDRMSLYFSYPVAMSVNIQQNQSIEFPDFTICPNSINSMPEIRRLLQKHFQNPDKKDLSVFELLKLINVPLEELWNLNAITTNNTQVYFYNKKGIPVKEYPDIELLKGMAYLGKCLVVHINGMVDYMGPAFALIIEQDVPSDVQFESAFAFTVYPHEDGSPAKHHAFFKGQVIPRSRDTAIALSLTTFRLLNVSHKICHPSVTAAYCWTNCVEAIFNRRVACKLPYMSAHKPPCTTPEQAQRTYETNLDVYMKVKQEDCKCRPKCTDIIYSLDLDVQTVTPNRTRVEIFFPQNTFSVISEYYSYTFIALICDIGGNLGLYLGLCLLTGLEILEAVLGHFFYQRNRVDGRVPTPVKSVQ